jgi:hypothetical protein
MTHEDGSNYPISGAGDNENKHLEGGEDEKERRDSSFGGRGQGRGVVVSTIHHQEFRPSSILNSLSSNIVNDRF